MDRFLRTQLLLGEEGFLRLQKSRVVVVGIGAVGGYVVEALARSGLGAIKLVDFDCIQPTNINRQLLALEETIGQPKVELAEKRVLSINPNCRVESEKVFVDEHMLTTLLDPVPDLVIDAIDSLNPKVQLLVGVHSRKIPLISSMGAALRTDPSRIQYGDIATSFGCPLAKRVRKRLRRQGVEKGINCVFSSEPVNHCYADPDSCDEGGVHPFEDRGRKRNILGSLPTITGIFGLVIANQSIMQLAGKGRLP